MANKKSLKRGNFYWYHGAPYLSVTQILQALDKPALRFWFGREVYRFFMNNPMASEQEALAAPWATSGIAKNRGTTVHSIVESWEHTGKVNMDIPEAYRGYAVAFNDWVNEFNADLLLHEESVRNDEHRYGGTLDLKVKIGGEIAIIDVKTGKDIYPESGLQLSAYKHCDDIEATRIGVILLQPNGTYKFSWMEDEFETFLHVKKIWEWQNKELLTAANYYQKGV